MQIGALIFPRMDQMDLTGPFEVLSLLPGAAYHLIWKEEAPIRDARGLILTPTTTLAEAPPLDVLHVPGGVGQEALMEDEEILEFVRRQAAGAKVVFSVCTGALICGAAGLLRGVHGTTHWNSFHLLGYFGAVPVDERVVIDGKFVSAAGVSSGVDGALRVAQMLAGERMARTIQLAIQYAPEPPFAGGTPKTSPPEVVAACEAAVREISLARLATAKRIGAKLGIADVRR
jgi:cyclohexyl-isocyanide hydratase